jgi:hypothetical protein
MLCKHLTPIIMVWQMPVPEAEVRRCKFRDGECNCHNPCRVHYDDPCPFDRLFNKSLGRPELVESRAETENFVSSEACLG